MKIEETTPPTERQFTITLSEDDAYKLLAVLGAQVYGPHDNMLNGYDQLESLLPGRRYVMRHNGHSYHLDTI